MAEALQSKTLFGQRGPVGGRTGHWLIWKRCFIKWEAGRREKDGEERSVAIITKERDHKDEGDEGGRENLFSQRLGEYVLFVRGGDAHQSLTFVFG